MTRFTRSALARLAQQKDGIGDSTPWRPLMGFVSSIIDSRISVKIGCQPREMNPVEEMAPGGTLLKKKARYAPNHTSINPTPRRFARIQADKPNESAPNERNNMPKKTVVPTNRTQTTLQSQPTSLQNQSSGRRTQTTSPQDKSTGNQTQSDSNQTPSTDQQKVSTDAPTESSGLQQNIVEHLVDEPDDNAEDADNDQTDDNNQETTHDETDETDEVPNSEKRKRGPTMGRGLIRSIGGPNGKKLKIEVDPAIGRPKNRVQSAKFSSEVGVVARDILPIPKKWKDLDEKSALDPCIDHMQIHMELNLEKPGVKQSVIERLKNSSRQQRYRLHIHFKKYANLREAKKNRPRTVKDQEQWEQLCDHFDSDQFKNQSRANKGNRKQVMAKHVTGRTPFTVIQNEISEKNGTDCDRIELYRSTHLNAKGKWSSDVAEKNWETMKESKLKYEADGITITDKEIVEQVLGKANGYIKGLGYGPKPTGKRNAHLQQELDETQAVLKEAQSENAAYKSKVDAMTEKLKDQEAKIDKLMAFMEKTGRSGVHEDVDEDVDEDADEDDY